MKATKKVSKRYITGIEISFVDGKYFIEVTRDKLRNNGMIYKETKLVQHTYEVSTSNRAMLNILFKLANCHDAKYLWITNHFLTYPSTSIHTTCEYGLKQLKKEGK